MTKKELLLTLVSEECAEISQRCSKAIRFGMDEIQKDQLLNNSERILGEFNDLVASMEVLFEKNFLSLISKDLLDKKLIKLKKYLQYSTDLGIIK